MSEITANKNESPEQRISQCDIFKDIIVIENIRFEGNKLIEREIKFPYVICLNQECDLINDFKNHQDESTGTLKDSSFLHIAIAPVFICEQFRQGKHWGDIFSADTIDSKNLRKIKQNEISRYHYLSFPCEDRIPEMIIDFKHFFTINRDILYAQLSNRFCSMAPLYKEKISQRFSFYISRIGLPD